MRSTRSRTPSRELLSHDSRLPPTPMRAASHGTHSAVVSGSCLRIRVPSSRSTPPAMTELSCLPWVPAPPEHRYACGSPEMAKPPACVLGVAGVVTAVGTAGDCATPARVRVPALDGVAVTVIERFTGESGTVDHEKRAHVGVFAYQ